MFFIEKGEKLYGKYLVMTFTHSNASYIQLLKNKNAESIVLAIRRIFEYLNEYRILCGLIMIVHLLK